jgi:5,10-methenyltetrahydromethanopterin hydrogenase
MNALIESLQAKVGLTEDQAKQAVEHMMEFIKSKIPASFHEHLDAAAIGNTIKLKGAEFLAEAQTKGSDLLQSAQEKISTFIQSK